MKKLLQIMLGFALLGVGLVHADAPPTTMPVQAAQDLDYAVLRREAKIQKLVKEFEAKVRETTAGENKLIDDLVKKYKLQTDEKTGRILDTVDAETGKIARYKDANPPAPGAKTAKK